VHCAHQRRPALVDKHNNNAGCWKFAQLGVVPVLAPIKWV
jgi:hypothetical protein